MKIKENLFRTVVTILLISTCTIPASAQTKSGISRTELQRHDMSTSDTEMVQAHIDFEPGTAFGNHKHPGEEIIYVLEGELEYIVEGKPPVVLKPDKYYSSLQAQYILLKILAIQKPAN